MTPLLVIVGMPGAGKSTVVSHLAQRGWPVVYFGGITLAEVQKQGLPATQDSEKRVREALRTEHGPAVYAKLSFPLIQQHLKAQPTVVDGLYSWAEYTWLRQALAHPLWVIAVCADRQVRYERLAKRAVRPLTPQEAERRDVAEIENLQKGGPIAIADFTVLNNGPLGPLLATVDGLVNGVLQAAGPESRTGRHMASPARQCRVDGP